MTLNDFNRDQIDDVKHALGLNYRKKPTRNNFYTSVNDKNWSDLASKGLATVSAGWTDGKAYFRLTYEAAKLIYTKPMSRKYFNDLH